MIIPSEILEEKSVIVYLQKRHLIKNYKKAKENLLYWLLRWLDFKKRKPSSINLWSFRINNKYRAIWSFDGEILKIIKILDHQ